MKKLEDADIIRMRREEWNSKLATMLETVSAVFSGNIDGDEKILIDAGLKVRHKKTQFLYTVDSVSSRDVILATPEGDKFIVDKETLEQLYEID